MDRHSAKHKKRGVLDGIDIEQLKYLIDESGIVVLKIKNYGTLNIGNPQFDDSSDEDSDSYDESDSSTDEEEEQQQVKPKEVKEKPKAEPKSEPKVEPKAEKKTEPVNKPTEVKSKTTTTVYPKQTIDPTREQLMAEQRKQIKRKHVAMQGSNKMPPQRHDTKRSTIKVEEVDDDDQVVSESRVFTSNEADAAAAEFVANNKTLQGGTNNPLKLFNFFTDFLKRYPNVVGGYLARGTAHAMLGQLPEAVENFTKAIELDPSSGDSFKRRGQTLVATGELMRGLDDLNKAVAMCGDRDGDCYTQRGSVYQMLKNYVKGRADFLEATKRNPMDYVAWNHLGLNNNALGLVDEAADAYARAIQIKDDYTDCYVNFGQLQKDAGQFERSKAILEKLFRMVPNHSNGHFICGVLYQQVGYHLRAVKEFTVAINNIADPQSGLDKDLDKKTDCYRYRGVTRSASGMFRLAAQDFDKAMECKSDDTAWYMKEIALYTHHHLEMPFDSWDLETFYPFFKEGFCKHLIPAALHRYVEQPPFDDNILDIDENSIPSTKIINQILTPAMNIGKFMQYNSQGFVKNKSQYLMGGMGAIEVGKFIRRVIPEWKTGGLTEEAALGLVDKIKWRDIMELIVKWRQISEPNDPVFWIDRLTHEQFEEGFGSHTPMYIGQTRVVRYYCQYQRAFNVVKKLLPDQVNIKQEWVEKIKEAKDLQDILDVLKSDFHVITPCRSDNFEGVVYEGTRLMIEQKEPDGYEFAIKTPCTLARWEKYDKELEACWKKIVVGVLTRKNSVDEQESLLRSVYTFAFFWYNFMPLSRGTAAAGFVFMMGMLASLGIKINKPIPKGMQTDWEALLCELPKDFGNVMFGWMKDSLTTFDIDAIPDLHASLPTLRSIIECFNYCPYIN
ncbi:Tetratricopeptide repeat protein [Entamoeba marina]